ncbi:MAG: hypothetical protein ACI4VL_02605 [Bacilli bacterium]
MGRELKRKQAKREGKNVKEVQIKNQKQELKPKTFVTIIIVLLLFFAILYLITGLFITKDIKWFDKKESEKTEQTSISDKILASDSLRQTEEEYYVYFYDTTNEDSSVSNIVSSIAEKVYRVDLHDDFNSNFIGEESGVVENISDLKVSDPTVIKVSREKVVEFYGGSEDIKTNLG